MPRFNENGLTEKQQCILDWILTYLKREKVSPSSAEISQGTGYNVGNISAVIYCLEYRGLITRFRDKQVASAISADGFNKAKVDEVVFDNEFDVHRFHSDYENLPRFARKCLTCGYDFTARGSVQRLCNYCRVDPMEAREGIKSSNLSLYF